MTKKTNPEGIPQEQDITTGTVPVKHIEIEDPNMDYFIREIGEGGWRKVSFPFYLNAIPKPEMDYMKKPKS